MNLYMFSDSNTSPFMTSTPKLMLYESTKSTNKLVGKF